MKNLVKVCCAILLGVGTLAQAAEKIGSLEAPSFSPEKGSYLDRGKWMAVTPEKVGASSGSSIVFPFRDGIYDLTLQAVGENDGASVYRVFADDQLLGEGTIPLAAQTYEEGERYHLSWTNVTVDECAVLRIEGTVGTDGKEFSRARWAALQVLPADGKPLLLSDEIATDAVAAAWCGKRQANGDASVVITGSNELWGQVTLDLAGPFAHEMDNNPNPFIDYNMMVTFAHESGQSSYTVPGYFAADGHAGETSAACGTVWRAHFSPDMKGAWTATIAFSQGNGCAVGEPGAAFEKYDGAVVSFKVGRNKQKMPDFRARGRLNYVGEHYLRFAGDGSYFMKVGADAPETLLAYKDFDGTITKKTPLKTWKAHLQDWTAADPSWKGGKGKGLIGALNYLSSAGGNAVSFLTYNKGGDGRNVWPFADYAEPLHYDCSKLDQWQMVFGHAQSKGLFLHFKLQEQENDDCFLHGKKAVVPAALDGGELGVQRKLYLRELIARFGHNLALNWNLGEENTQSFDQQLAMAKYIQMMDAYNHIIVIHSFPNWQERVYKPLLGENSPMGGASLQNSWNKTHAQAITWVNASAEAGRPWVVCNDEQGPASCGIPPDIGYPGYDPEKYKNFPTMHDTRKATLWGALMAGAAGVEYYFGYKLPQNDLVCEDWRSREKSWGYGKIALDFFSRNKIPFWNMSCADALVGNSQHDNSKYCLALENECYLVYLPKGGSAELDLRAADGSFKVRWFNPRTGGKMLKGAVKKLPGGEKVALGAAPVDADEDWLVVIRK